MRRLTPEALQWIGLFAAPLAWTVQLVAGFGVTVAACSAGGRGIGLDAWELGLTAVAAVVAIAGQAAAVSAWRATRGRRDDAPPPAGRIHFLADAALLSNALFIVMILLGGIAALDLSCRPA